MDPTGSLSKGFADCLWVIGMLLRWLEYHANAITLSTMITSYSTSCFMKTFSSFRKHNQVPDLAVLLSIITFGDEHLLTLTPKEAEEFLTSQQSINPVLQKAWKNSSSKEIRQLGESFVATQLLVVPLIIIAGVLWPVVRETRRWFSSLCYWDWWRWLACSKKALSTVKRGYWTDEYVSRISVIGLHDSLFHGRNSLDKGVYVF